MQEEMLPPETPRRSPSGWLVLALVLAFVVGLGGSLLLFSGAANRDLLLHPVRSLASLLTKSLAPSQAARGAGPASENQSVSGEQDEQSTLGERGTENPATATPNPDIALFARYAVPPASPEEMFSEFTCPCCGKLIADCTCGMAAERKGFLAALAAVGRSKLQTYVAYGDQYGWDSFVSEEARTVARKFKVAHAPAARPRVVIEPLYVDLGQVSQAKGQVQTRVLLRNEGQEALIVDALSTSCGCTSVSLAQDGVEGPWFGSGMQSSDWSATIAPGSSADLLIRYDPNVHKDARGKMRRDIFVSSNDPIDGVVKVTIELEQVD